jgi:hypothetical protein
MPHKRILAGIRSYASAYAAFQALQDAHPDLMAVGDQKTGVVGEYYSLLYARSLYPHAKVAYAPDPSQAGWDIEVDLGLETPSVKIQVKTVSAYSRSRAITPISPGWDHLYLLYLSRGLEPEGFWIVETANIFKGKSSLTGLSMRRPDFPDSGSQCIPWGKNRVKQLLEELTKHGTPDIGG